MTKKGKAIDIIGGTWAGYPAWLNLKKAPTDVYTYVIVEDDDGEDYDTRIHSIHWQFKGMVANCDEQQLVFDFPELLPHGVRESVVNES
jgi:hypothetical protein